MMEGMNGVKIPAKSCVGRVGYWFNAKKTKTFRLDEFKEVCRDSGLQLVEIDLDHDMTDQGPFDIILHKVTKIMTRAISGDELACRRISNLKNYIETHPSVLVIDSMEAVEGILNRTGHASLGHLCEQHLGNGSHFFVPKCVAVHDRLATIEQRMVLKQSNLEYPLICKPLNPLVKEMMMVFDDKGLSDIEPPCMLQEFIEHDAVMYKVYCIGNECYIVPRKSLKNLNGTNKETIHFSSRDISRHSSSSCLTKMCSVEDLICHKATVPDIDLLVGYAKVIQSLCKLELVGMDFVRDKTTGNYGMVDINVFPGFSGVPDLHQAVVKVLLDKLSTLKQTVCS